MRILALDLATKTGWALCDPTSAMPVVSGMWDFAIKRDESGGMRLIRLQSKLRELEPINLVVFESVRSLRHANAVAVISEMVGIVKAWSLSIGAEFRGYAPPEIKKHATGKGNAKKPDMVIAARILTGKDITDDNEADALCMLHLAIMERYGKRDDLFRTAS